LAKAVLDILVDPEEGRRMAEKAYATVRETFSAATMAQRYLDIYEEMTSSCGRSRRRGEKDSELIKARNG
jgi:glycosyltransferase involved in cell wall biosynthesis